MAKTTSITHNKFNNGLKIMNVIIIIIIIIYYNREGGEPRG